VKSEKTPEKPGFLSAFYFTKAVLYRRAMAASTFKLSDIRQLAFS
jgi:hypothetical protein